VPESPIDKDGAFFLLTRALQVWTLKRAEALAAGECVIVKFQKGGAGGTRVQERTYEAILNEKKKDHVWAVKWSPVVRNEAQDSPFNAETDDWYYPSEVLNAGELAALETKLKKKPL